MILSLTPSVATVSESALWLASGTYVLAALWPTPKTPSKTTLVAATRLLPLAWILHAFTLALALIDWASPAPVARFGFAPALSMMLWCVVGVYMIERLHTANQQALQVLAALSAMSLALSWWFPGQAHPQIHQNWAPLHWVLGLTSYGLVGAALLHAWFWRIAERRLRAGAGAPPSMALGIPLLRLETLTFRFVAAAFLTLSLTLLLGIWHSQPWRWDHKTVLSVMAWAVFACLLLGRVWLGWRGRVAIRWLYVGSALLLLAYAGSRFVLEVILQRPDRLG